MKIDGWLTVPAAKSQDWRPRNAETHRWACIRVSRPAARTPIGAAGRPPVALAGLALQRRLLAAVDRA
jgi:hypothetical protein